MSWTVRPGRSGKLLELVNETGGPATDVVMKLRGRAVGGMFSRPDWSFKAAAMDDGQGVEAPFKAAVGARTDPPRVEISWTAPNGQRRETVVPLPL